MTTAGGRIAELDLAWAAGFLEGEGSFMLWQGRPRLKVSQVDREPLERLKRLFDGTICEDGGPRRKQDNPRRQTMWYWSLTGERARAVMLAVQPFMSDRRKAQIAHALSAQPNRDAPESGDER